MHHLGYWSLALYAASFVCYAWNLYVPNPVGRPAATLLLAGGILVQYLYAVSAFSGAAHGALR